MGDTAESEG